MDNPGKLMDNTTKLKDIFMDSLAISSDTDFSTLAYRSIDEWDSVAHMQLVGEIEDAFDIMLDTQNVLDMSSFSKALEILGKYGVDFSS
jgi:acyl carrier protein